MDLDRFTWEGTVGSKGKVNVALPEIRKDNKETKDAIIKIEIDIRTHR